MLIEPAQKPGRISLKIKLPPDPWGRAAKRSFYCRVLFSRARPSPLVRVAQRGSAIGRKGLRGALSIGERLSVA